MKSLRGVYLLISILLCAQFRLTGQVSQVTVKVVDNDQYDQDETAITVDPNNTQHLMATWNDFTNAPFPNPGYGFSTDGGVTWQTGILRPDSTNGYDNGFDPSCAFDKLGNAFYVYIAQGPSDGTVPMTAYISRTRSDGPPWTSHPITSVNNTNQDKPCVTIDNNNKIYVAWTDRYGSSGSQTVSTIYVAYSTDQGSSFSTSNQIVTYTAAGCDSGENTLSVESSAALYPLAQGATIAVGPNGYVYLVWLDATSASNAKIKVRRSTNGGQNFENAIDVTPNPIGIVWRYSVGPVIRASSLPTMAIDPSSGYIFVAYTQNDRVNNIDDLNIYYCISRDAGSTWSSPIIATASTVNDQFWPSLSASSSGTISLAYYQGTSTAVDVYLAQQNNYAQLFSTPNTRITSTSMNPANVAYNHHGADYMGLVSVSTNYLYPVWSDFHSTNPKSSNAYAAIVQYTPLSPPPPVLSLPTNGATVSIPPVLSWNTMGGWTSYTLQVDTDANFTSPLNISGITGTSYTVTCLVCSTTYYWRVGGVYNGTSYWSDSRYFNTQIQQLSSPTNGATVSIPPTLSWNSLTEATSYRLQVAKDDSFTNCVKNLSGITTTSDNVTCLSYATTYYWRVVPHSCGDTSHWSETRYFNTQIEQLTSPGNCATVSNPPTLTWSQAGEATSYRLQVATNSNFSNLAINVSGITTTSYSASGLSNTTTYYWRVVPHSCGDTAHWSDAWHFQTSPPPTPQLTLSTVVGWCGGVKCFHPKLTWTTVSWCNIAYKLYRYTPDPDCGNGVPGLLYSGSASTYTDTSIGAGNGCYTYYYVKAVANADQQSTTSDTVQFQTNEEPAKRLVGDKVSLPTEITMLQQNYPNPFNPQATIYYTLHEAVAVRLVVLDVLGREVKVLVDGVQDAGYKTVQFDGSNLPSGVYFYRLTAGKSTAIKKMLLMK